MSADRPSRIATVIAIALTVAEVVTIVVGEICGRNLPTMLQVVGYFVFCAYLVGATLCASSG